MQGRSIYVEGINHKNAPIPLGARVGGIFYSSAISGIDAATGELPSSGVRQVANMFENVRSVLAAASLTSNEVVSVDVLLESEDLRAEVNLHWVEWFPDPVDRPARHATIGPLSGKNQAQLKVVAVQQSAEGIAARSEGRS